ncbi:hypothetical protein [Stenotrophomonas sp. 24(2023)]|uniref:hypothetical protein n=1 Tax=Stenotrophomonas sp. 24(2023) TaxID=3068324 RepID=UPI0027E178FA|nr:hypothetical protein [Stenotrophomonas sp. 24(2023)]WMJ71101.1 hypothetical protein Q9R17_08415 [Stenotrophomonas sp. 24(2023)]
MLIDTDAVAALDAANAAIAAVTPRQRRAVLAEFYLRDAMSPARALRCADIDAVLQAELQACIALGLLKRSGPQQCYFDLGALQRQQKAQRRTALRVALFMPVLVLAIAAGTMALL